MCVTNLSLAVDSNDTAWGFMWGSDKDGVTTDAVHEDTRATLDVIQVHIPILGDQVYDIMLWAHLKEIDIFTTSSKN